MSRHALRRLLLAIALGAVGCERLVGIHGARDASGADLATSDGGDDRGVPAVDRPNIDVGASDATVADGSADHRGDQVEPPGDAGTSDRRDLGGGTVDASADAAHCGALWHAEGVPAGVYAIASTASTACSYPAGTLPVWTAALNTSDFRGALACGSCLRVQPSFGSLSVVVQVVDLGGATGILLSQAAIDTIATPGTSALTVDWQLVPCDTQADALTYLIKDGSNANYIGVQIGHQRYPVSNVVAVGSGAQTVPFTLKTYNYWESTVAGIGAAPLTLRSTDINGQVVEDTGIAVTAQARTTGAGQFPICQ